MAEADPFASADDTYSIVVAGNMNPAIHHPAWYKLIKALSDEEFESTRAGAAVSREPAAPTQPLLRKIFVSAPGTDICTPALSQFTAGRIRVMCVEQNWTVVTPDLGLWDRISALAAAVFEALPYTPVAAYGLNFVFNRKTGAGDVATRLADIVDSTSLALPKEATEARSAKIGYTLTREDRSLNVSIEPSGRSSDMVFVAVNAHHPITPKGAGYYQFDLGALLRQSAQTDLAEAQRLLQHVTRSLERQSS